MIARPFSAKAHVIAVVVARWTLTSHQPVLGCAGEAIEQASRCRFLCRFLDAGDCDDSRALDRPAFKKRQGTKSRSVVQRRCGLDYGDFAVAGYLRNMHTGGCDDGVSAKVGWARGGGGTN